ncbi:hypothetical protein [Streptomyces sp. ODS28]|uniref:cupin domain-containing protein n=1 Tax=Streptomyces sp. ODS28 TaxID=3136688 RepID=UPI0031EF5389
MRSTPSAPADPDPADAPRLVGDALALAGDLPGARRGAAWSLDAPGRQLDANLVRLPPHDRIELHSEPDLDVLLMVTAGRGTVVTGAPPHTGEEPLALYPGAVVWLPRGSTRALVADGAGLAYLTVHRRRPGLRIRGPERAAELL